VQHDQVIQTIFQQTTVLPLRFGTCFTSLSALQDCLTNQYNLHLEKLVALAGKAEYTLQLRPQPLASVSPTTKGKDYFMEKKRLYEAQAESQRQQQQTVQEIVAAIAPTVVSHRLSHHEPNLLKLSLLVQQADLNQFQHQLHTIVQNYPDWVVELSTPLPPYNFAET
jgi:hypothetical protein